MVNPNIYAYLHIAVGGLAVLYYLVRIVNALRRPQDSHGVVSIILLAAAIIAAIALVFAGVPSGCGVDTTGSFASLLGQIMLVFVVIPSQYFSRVIDNQANRLRTLEDENRKLSRVEQNLTGENRQFGLENERLIGEIGRLNRENERLTEEIERRHRQ